MFIDKLNNSLLEAGVADCLEYAESLYPFDHDDDQSLPFSAFRFIRPFLKGSERNSPTVAIKTLQGEVVGHMMLRSLFGEGAAEFDLPQISDWHALASLYEFVRAPTKKRLANIFRESDHLEVYRSLSLPWPIKLFLDDFTDFSTVAAKIEGGAIGDTDDWRRAEERWLSVGVSGHDFLRWAEGDYREIATIGTPPPNVDRFRFNRERADSLNTLYLTLLEQTSFPNKKRKLLQLLSSSIDALKSTLASKIADQQIIALSEGLLSDRQFLFAARDLPLDNPDFFNALQTVDRIGQTKGIELLGFGFPTRLAIDLLSRNPSLRGLLSFVLPMRGNKGRGQYAAEARALISGSHSA